MLLVGCLYLVSALDGVMDLGDEDADEEELLVNGMPSIRVLNIKC